MRLRGDHTLAPDDPSISTACTEVLQSIRALNRQLALVPVPSPELHDMLRETAQASADLSDLLHGMVAEGEALDVAEEGEWLVLSLPGDAPCHQAHASFRMVPSSAHPASAHDIVWRLHSLSLEEDDFLDRPRPLSDPSDIGRPSTLSFAGDPSQDSDLWSHAVNSSFASHPDLLDLFATQGALVKTIKNDEWPAFLDKLALPSLKTSTTLLPPNGRFMRLFGTESSRCGGLVWSRHRLALSPYWAWPSGYYAKTEFNIDEKGRLKNGREETLVLLEDLMAANNTFTAQHSYNEVYGDVDAAALAAVFCRTLQRPHLLLCLGVRDLIARLLGVSLPVVIIDPVQGVRLFGEGPQLELIHSVLAENRPPRPLVPGAEWAFLDLGAYPHLQAEDVLAFHGLYGCTEPCLRTALLTGGPLTPLTLHGLSHAIRADNVPAATSLVRLVFPHFATSTDMVQAAEQLQALLLRIRSSEMLVPVGAITALCFFVSGQSVGRCQEACQVLQDWITQSASLSFRVQSWKELRDRHAAPHMAASMMPFLGHKAVATRTAFHAALQHELGKAQTAVQFFMRLCSLCAPLQHPCLRLELLQYVTGLHTQFTVSILKKTAEFAFGCLALGF